jgi:hypothetical protein
MPLPAWMTVESMTAVGGLLGGLAGYAIREFQNRITPFFQIYSIAGGSVAGWERVDVDIDIRTQIEDTFYIKPLDKNEPYLEVFKCWDRADDVKQLWPKVRSLVDDVLGADEQGLEEALYHLLDSAWFDRWFTILTARSDLTFPTADQEAEKKTSVFIDPQEQEKNGTIWISTPYGATSFAQQMNNPAMHQRLLPFVQCVERLEADKIKTVLTNFKQTLETEYQVALKVSTSLKEVVDSYSRWMFKLAFTNLSNSPTVIEKQAEIVVTDTKTKTKYPMECALAKLTVQKDGVQVKHSDAPISVRAGETIEFAVVTTEAQREMDLGTDIRNVFNRRSGTCQLSLHIQRPGVFKRQHPKSEPIPFESTDKPNNEMEPTN